MYPDVLYKVQSRYYCDSHPDQGFLWDLKFPPFSLLLCSKEKRAGFSNPIKNRVLESRSNIFFSPASTKLFSLMTSCVWTLDYWNEFEVAWQNSSRFLSIWRKIVITLPGKVSQSCSRGSSRHLVKSNL